MKYAFLNLLVLLSGITNAQINPDSATYYIEIGIASHANEKYDEAVEYLNKAILFDSTNTQEGFVYRIRAESKFYLKDYEGAILDYNKAVALDSPASISLYNMRGIAKRELKLYNAALLDFNKAIKRYRKYDEAYLSRAITYERMGNKKKAKKDYKKAELLRKKNERLLLKNP